MQLLGIILERKRVGREIRFHFCQLECGCDGQSLRSHLISCSCCCCQVASVVSDSVRPQRPQPTSLPHPWDSPGKNIGVGCHFLLQCIEVKSESESEVKVKVKSLSHVQLLATPWTAAHHAPPSMGFSRQEYWSGLPSPSLVIVHNLH